MALHALHGSLVSFSRNSAFCFSNSNTATSEHSHLCFLTFLSVVFLFPRVSCSFSPDPDTLTHLDYPQLFPLWQINSTSQKTHCLVICSTHHLCPAVRGSRSCFPCFTHLPRGALLFVCLFFWFCQTHSSR